MFELICTLIAMSFIFLASSISTYVCVEYIHKEWRKYISFVVSQHQRHDLRNNKGRFTKQSNSETSNYKGVSTRIEDAEIESSYQLERDGIIQVGKV